MAREELCVAREELDVPREEMDAARKAEQAEVRLEPSAVLVIGRELELLPRQEEAEWAMKEPTLTPGRNQIELHLSPWVRSPSNKAEGDAEHTSKLRACIAHDRIAFYDCRSHPSHSDAM